MNARPGLLLRRSATIVLALVAGGCADAGQTPDDESSVLAGWYSQASGQARFQPCGQSRALEISDSAELGARAKDFGLMEGDPVYVRLAGSERDGQFDVARIEQFGSPVPIRDCPMSGLTIQSATPSGG